MFTLGYTNALFNRISFDIANFFSLIDEPLISKSLFCLKTISSNYSMFEFKNGWNINENLEFNFCKKQLELLILCGFYKDVRFL